MEESVLEELRPYQPSQLEVRQEEQVAFVVKKRSYMFYWLAAAIIIAGASATFLFLSFWLLMLCQSREMQVQFLDWMVCTTLLIAITGFALFACIKKAF